jgi:hypothetical protein
MLKMSCNGMLKYNIKMDLREMEWAGMDLFIWFRIATSGGLLKTR